MLVSELETPALLIDLDIMERNLERVATYAREHGLRLRPHTKTHKTPELARKQLDLGAAGLAVAKTTEAEVMLEAHPDDMLVAYPVLGQQKLERLIRVAQATQVTVALDSDQAACGLSAAAVRAGVTIGVLTEVDVGLHRVGVKPAQLLALVRAVCALPGLRWEGVTFYPGHIKALDDAGLAAIDQLAVDVPAIITQLKAEGFEPRIVSGGSTPALFHSHRIPMLNEIRPGTYIFNDRNTVECGACAWDDCAVSILTTVVSTAVDHQMVLDGGSKTFSSDRLSTGGDALFGRIVEAPAARFHKMNEEHAYVDIGGGKPSAFRVGDRVRVIPNHVCVAVNLHERLYGVRNGAVETVWEVKGRGKLW